MLKIHGRDAVTCEALELRIENGLIAEISSSDISTDLWLAPGFVDLQQGAPADVVRFRWSPGEQSLAIEDVLVMGQPVSIQS